MAKRRGNGEGTIYRADGRWRAVVSLPTGKRKYLSGRTRDETGRKLTALLKNIQDGLPVTADRETINQFAAGWLAVKKQSIKASTWRRYESLLRVNVLPMLGRVQISKVTPAHLQRLYADRMTAGRGPQTITHIHRVVHAMLSDATRWGNVARNVAALVTPPSVPHRDIRAFDADQALRFLGAAMGTKHEALWTVLISTGVRIGEVAALRWSDIDLPDR